MLDFTELVGMMTQSGASSSGMDRMRRALSDQGLGGGGLLGELLGGSQNGGGLLSTLGGQRQGGALGGLAELAGSLLGGGRSSGSGSGLGGLGELAGSMLGGGRSSKSSLGGGVMALLGSLALSALSNMNQQSGAPEAKALPLALREPQDDEEAQAMQNTAMVVLRAMINAAKADGQIDQDEMHRIVGKLREAGADEEARAYILREMDKPMDLDRIIRHVPNAEVAAQAYAASLLTIKVDTRAEQDYMRRLAQELKLDPDAVARIHQILGV